MVYSFLNVSCSMAGPGGVLNLGSGAASAEEGITVERSQDKNVMNIGADGKGQHSLIADESGKVTIRLLKTSPLNAALMIMYNLQTVSSQLHGRNVITIIDSGRNDYTVCQFCAFRKAPTLTYAKEGGIMEWELDAISINTILGQGQ